MDWFMEYGVSVKSDPEIARHGCCQADENEGKGEILVGWGSGSLPDGAMMLIQLCHSFCLIFAN
jgi:hypothetical protein